MTTAGPAALVASCATASNDGNEDSAKRKRPKNNNQNSVTTHLSQFLASPIPQPGGLPSAAPLPGGPPPAGTAAVPGTYAIALAAPMKAPTSPAKPSSAPTDETPSVCLKAMLAGAQMLRTATVIPPGLSLIPYNGSPCFWHLNQIGTLQQKAMETLCYVRLHRNRNRSGKGPEIP